MRPFDFKESWLDDERKPLAGRVSFCKLHTTVLENIYDNQGYPCNNPMFTNTLGQLDSQVFLKDNTDYTVRFEKYVGNGDMTEDQDNWLFQYSCDVLWNVYGIDIAGDAYQVATNISELRSTAPDTVKDRDGRKVILLGGYNAVGDKPTVMYVWNPYSIASDNGGSTIKVDTVNTGRWELVNLFDESGVDVRHFGVFGADSASDATDAMSLAIGIASNYAASINRPLYFPSNQGYTWYKINGLNISGALFAKDTRVFGNTGTESRITVRDQDTYLDVYTNSNYLGRFTITGGTVRTSWGVNSTNCVFDPELRLIVDSPVNTSSKSWTGIIVDALEHIDHASFDNCQLNAVGTVGDYCSFENMRVTESMFEQGVNLNTITVFDNDIIDLSDFPTTSTWFSLVLENSGRTFDFEGRVVDSTCENHTNADITYRNAVFSGYVAEQSSVTFENCRGSVVLSSSVQRIGLRNCQGITLGGAGSVMTSFVAIDSVVSFGRAMTIASWEVTGSNIEDSGITHYGTTMAFTDSYVKSGLSVTTLNALNSSFYANIVAGVPTFIKCDFYGGTVSQNNVTEPSINFTFRNCNFYAGGGHNFASTVPNTLVVGEWTGNYSALDTHFISFNRANIDPDEQHHTYKYDGNVGPNVLQKLSAKWTDVLYMGPNYPGTGDNQGVLQNKVMWSGWSYGDKDGDQVDNRGYAIGYLGRMSRNDGDVGGSTLVDYYLTEFQMFSIGTQNVGLLALSCYMPSKWTSDMVISGSSIGVFMLPTQMKYQAAWAMIDETEKLWKSSNVGSLGEPKCIMYYGGYTWRITHCCGMGILGYGVNVPGGDIDWRIPVSYELKQV